MSIENEQNKEKLIEYFKKEKEKKLVFFYQKQGLWLYLLYLELNR